MTLRTALTWSGRALFALSGLLAIGYVAWHDVAAVKAPPSLAPAAGSQRSSAPPVPPARAACGRLRIGWTAWADAEFVTALAARLLREKLGCSVQLFMTDIGLQYRGLAAGELDLMLMAWLPLTHRPYWEKISNAVIDLGALYTGARLGWVVPAYVPADRLASIEDLHRPDVRRRLRGRIQGIDPGSGLMQTSERALSLYGLSGYKLRSGSGAAMTAAVQRAIRLHRWIVATAWMPHWMFVRWHLRYLEDPKGALGRSEQVHALARRGLPRDYPDPVVAFITRMYFPIDELQQALLFALEHSTEAAVDRYIATHPRRIHYWLTGDL